MECFILQVSFRMMLPVRAGHLRFFSQELPASLASTFVPILTMKRLEWVGAGASS
jgi:hypothetical protein